MRIRPFGERALLAEVDSMEEVHRLRQALARAARPGVEEIVAGATTVLVVADPGVCDLGRLAAELPDWDLPAPEQERSALVTLPVRYDGPDLEGVAELCAMSREEVVRRHLAATYTVAFMGFSPGFAYLAGGDPRLRVPRLETPRTRVPAGSVALAGEMSAVYPQATPGGWRLLGRTPSVMFDPRRAPPALVVPGDRIRFVEDPSAPDPPEPASAARTGGAGGERRVEVERPGPLTTVQDLGRVGLAHLGVPRAGAVDPLSLGLANRAVGNPPGAAALEATVSGPRLRFGSAARVAVVGAPAAVDGVPLAQAAPGEVGAGSVLTVGSAAPGLRCYVAVDGAFAVEAVLGSRSCDTLSGLGPLPLRAGDVLVLGAANPPAEGDAGVTASAGRSADPTAGPGAGPNGDAAGGVLEVRVVPGPHVDWLDPDALARLCSTEFTVSTASDRTGVRCEGALLGAGSGELPSLGMVAGAVQVPPDGRPIVLLANHAPTGGYPVAAVVVPADLRLVGQARPGSRIRFRISGTGSAAC